MKLFSQSLLASVLLIPALVMAHGASRITVEEKITIDADTAEVWDAVKQFDNLHSWHPAVKATDADGNTKGAQRTLTFENDATIKETLRKFDDEKMSLMYAIDEMDVVATVTDDHGDEYDVPAVPVRNYKSWIKVTEVDGGAEVSWTGKFFRVYNGNHHAPDEISDEAAENAISGFYQAGLKAAKSKLEN